MAQSIIFKRGNQNIIAKITSITIEPLDTGNGKQVVFFCKDSEGKRYRVPKSEVIIQGQQKERKSKDKKKRRKERCK